MTTEMKKYDITLNGKRRTVVGIYHQSEKTGIKGPFHYIHILDRSGSMGSYINDLIDGVKKTLSVMSNEDYISVIWFSSPGQFKTVIKGAKPTDNIISLMDSMRSVLGTTCFSQPIAEAKNIVDDLKAICSNISITLFTDGQPVVPWSEEKEEKDSLTIINSMKEDILAFNTIGFGNYYNRKFLLDMSSLSQFGEMIHSSNILEYLDLFKGNMKKIEELSTDPVTISSIGQDIVYLNPSFTKLENSTMYMKSLHKDSNQFFLVSGNGAFEFSYNNKVYSSSDVKESKIDPFIMTFYYAYAYSKFYDGFRSDALEILAHNTHDKYLVDKQINVFTYDEVQDYLNELKKAVFDEKFRMLDGKTPPNYIPKADALCVMDVLTTLQDGDNYYIPFSKNVPEYERIGRKSVDEENKFTKNDEEVKAPIKDFVWNKDKLNLSVRFVINGTVKLNSKSAKRVNLPEVVDSHIYRNHTFIKDGKMNIKQAEFQLDEKTIAKLKQMKVPMFITRIGYIIDFKKLPIINKMYIDKATGIEDIFTYTRIETEMEAYRKVVKYYLEQVYDKLPSAAKEKEFTSYTLEQIQVLEDHGIGKDMSYGGVKVVTPKVDECKDSYVTRTMSFYFKGLSSLPKVEDALKGKKGVISDYMRKVDSELKKDIAGIKCSLDKPTIELKDFLKRIVEDINKDLSLVRTKLNILKLAKLTTGDWFQGLSIDDKGNYIFEKDGMTLIAKADRKVEYL